MLICSGAGAIAPSNLMARQNGVAQNGVGSILVSWTLPSLRPVDGYQITTGSPPDFTSGFDVGRDVSSHTMNLALGMMHSVSIKARSRHYPGLVVGPVPVTVRGKGEIYDLLFIFIESHIIQHLKGQLLCHNQ